MKKFKEISHYTMPHAPCPMLLAPCSLLQVHKTKMGTTLDE
ncbi:MAG: hypothetical protein V2I37_13525 [Marinilabiliaceae bacterium]|nr:hypothetical protein [Marinilabiliaceae bacterium]